MNRTQTIYHSPVGTLLIESTDGQQINSILFTDEHLSPCTLHLSPLLDKAVQQLDAYFAGQRRTFDLPLRMHATPFTERVWQALQEIPYGTTLTYSDLARRLGDINAVRAVGHANGSNPFAIVVPCHRIIGAGGSLTGYRWGLERKRWLLDFEQHISGKTLF